MVGTVIAPSLSGIIQHKELGFSPSWLITLPALGVVVFAPLIGWLLNKMSPLKLLALGLVPYAVLGLIGAFIDNQYLLILDRFLLGAATVAIQVSVTAYIAAQYEGEARMKMIAWQGMAIELGGVVFLAIGGILSELFWQYPFYIYLIALVCLLLVFKTLPKIEESVTEEETSAEVTTREKLKTRIIIASSLLAMMLFFIGFVTLPLYLPTNFGFSESETGYLMAFISVIAIVTASQMPRMVKLLGDGKTVTLGFVFFMLGYIVLALATGVPFLILTAICIGIGFGFTIPLLNHMTIEVSNSQNQGKNLGLFSMAVFGGQFLSTFIEYISKNYMAIYGVAAALALVIAIVMYYQFEKASSD